ncbi:MAG: P-loop NTPase family protein [Candidatus Methanospirareceae archaeon]
MKRLKVSEEIIGGNNTPEFIKPYLKEAIEFPDIDFLAILGIERREAERVVKRKREEMCGYKEREVFCTKETREIKEDILKILSSYPVTRNGKDMVLMLCPSLDSDEIRRRFRDVEEVKRLREIIGEERIGRLKEKLSKAVLERVDFGKKPLIVCFDRDIEGEIKGKYGDFVRFEYVNSVDAVKEKLMEEDFIFLIGREIEISEHGIVKISNLDNICEVLPGFVVKSFIARRKAIEVVMEILNEFDELKHSFLFESISLEDLKAVIDIIRDGEGGEEEKNLDEVIYKKEEEINREVERIVKSGGGVEDFKFYLEEVLASIAEDLELDREEQEVLWRGAYDNLERGLPFEFSRAKIVELKARYNRRMGEKRYYRLRGLAERLWRYRGSVSEALKNLFYLDFLLAVSQFSLDFGLNIPEINEGGGLGVIAGRNLFLLEEELKGRLKVEPVSYSIGKTLLGIFGATPHPIAILTGANSGGKTCLLITLAVSVILTLLGLPVPAEKAEIPIAPLYFYKRKAVKKTGSFEHSIRALSRIFMRSGAKVVLIDELEALTEPGAMGRIMASFLNNFPKDTLAVIVTHLIHEILPHISLRRVRVDGIESAGLDEKGNIIVNRQPIFNHIGSSTPELVIKKLLAGIRKGDLRRVYEEIIRTLERERKEVVLS